MFKNAEVVKEGKWRYGDLTECRVRIVKWHILYGTSDYEEL